VEELKSALELAPPRPGGWQVPIVTTAASRGEGIEELVEALSAHRAHLEEKGLLKERRRERARFELQAAIQEWGRRLAEQAGPLVERVASGAASPEEAARELLKNRFPPA